MTSCPHGSPYDVFGVGLSWTYSGNPPAIDNLTHIFIAKTPSYHLPFDNENCLVPSGEKPEWSDPDWSIEIKSTDDYGDPGNDFFIDPYVHDVLAAKTTGQIGDNFLCVLTTSAGPLGNASPYDDRPGNCPTGITIIDLVSNSVRVERSFPLAMRFNLGAVTVEEQGIVTGYRGYMNLTCAAPIGYWQGGVCFRSCSTYTSSWTYKPDSIYWLIVRYDAVADEWGVACVNDWSEITEDEDEIPIVLPAMRAEDGPWVIACDWGGSRRMACGRWTNSDVSTTFELVNRSSPWPDVDGPAWPIVAPDTPPPTALLKDSEDEWEERLDDKSGYPSPPSGEIMIPLAYLRAGGHNYVLVQGHDSNGYFYAVYFGHLEKWVGLSVVIAEQTYRVNADMLHVAIDEYGQPRVFVCTHEWLAEIDEFGQFHGIVGDSGAMTYAIGYPQSHLSSNARWIQWQHRNPDPVGSYGPLRAETVSLTRYDGSDDVDQLNGTPISYEHWQYIIDRHPDYGGADDDTQQRDYLTAECYQYEDSGENIQPTRVKEWGGNGFWGYDIVPNVGECTSGLVVDPGRKIA